MQTQEYNFPVALKPLFLQGRDKPVPRLRAVVREDSQESIGIVSDRYRLVTHDQALSIAKPFTDSFGESSVKHMLEKNGARLVSQFTYKDKTHKIPSVGDTVALRIDIMNSYDGSEPLKFNIAALVLRCLNGMTAIQESLDLRYRHTGQWEFADIKLPDPDKIWERFIGKAEIWDRWSTVRNSTSYVEHILKRLMATSAIGTKFIQEKKGELEAAPTKWEFYDKMTYTVTHMMPRIRESERIRRLRALDLIFSTTTRAEERA